MERYYRDVRVGVVMGPSTGSLVLVLGQAALALDTQRRRKKND